MSMIDREFLKQYKRTLQAHEQGGGEPFDVVYWSDIEKAPAIDSAIKWVEISQRPATPEEKEEIKNVTFFDFDVDDDIKFYDCQMPNNGQEVLITTRWGRVEIDTYWSDNGAFENNDDPDDVIAWAPLPEPYKKHSKT